MAAKAVASPLAFRRDVRGPLGRPAPGGCRSGTGTGTGLPGVLYWSGGAGGSRLLAARARGRNRFGGGGGGRGASRDEAAEEDEDEAADVVIVDAGDEEEYASDELSGFRGLVLDLSYRWGSKLVSFLCVCVYESERILLTGTGASLLNHACCDVRFKLYWYKNNTNKLEKRLRSFEILSTYYRS